jgi:hypothetical protein
MLRHEASAADEKDASYLNTTEVYEKIEANSRIKH